MKLVEDVYEIAESFMNNSKYVKLNEPRIKEMADTMLTAGKTDFPFPDKTDDTFKLIVKEIVAASINYCYWYGRHDIRPGGASSTWMYQLLNQAFFDFEYADTEKFSECIERFIRALSIQRFPLLEERARHLRELKSDAIELAISIENQYSVGINFKNDMTYIMTYLVEKFPGFASDMFLKRASLFFIQLYRRFGWFGDELNLLHVPADYQVPKMLEHYSCIDYSDDLKYDIENHELIPKHSIKECEIRAATVLTIKKLCELTRWNVADVDSFFFLRRHDATEPFHLTITTDY